MKKKKSFNIVDLIVLIVIFSTLILGYKKINAFNSQASDSVKASKLKITYYVEEVPSFIADSIEKGDKVTEQIQSSDFGEITDIKIQPSISWSIDELGNYTKSTKKDHSSLELTFETTGTINEIGTFIDKSEYYIGQTLTLYIGEVVINTGRISSIELIK